MSFKNWPEFEGNAKLCSETEGCKSAVYGTDCYSGTRRYGRRGQERCEVVKNQPFIKYIETSY